MEAFGQLIKTTKFGWKGKCLNCGFMLFMERINYILFSYSSKALVNIVRPAYFYSKLQWPR